MSDFPTIENVDAIVISPATPQSIGEALNAMGLGSSAAGWPSNNKAVYTPFSVFSPVTIVKLFVVNGATVAGNIDVGIYDRGGVRLASAGTNIQSGTSVVQEFNITDLNLNPGLYYLAASLSNVTGTLEVWSPTVAIGRSLGIAEQTSAFPLPATGTLAVLTGTLRVPFVGATQRTTV